MTQESHLLARVRLAIGGRPDVRIFRNNCGKLQDATGRWVTYGLCPGSSDLIGWRSEVIAGIPIARFLALELKSPSGVITTEQQSFIDAVNRAGGRGRVIRSEQDAIDAIST